MSRRRLTTNSTAIKEFESETTNPQQTPRYNLRQPRTPPPTTMSISTISAPSTPSPLKRQIPLTPETSPTATIPPPPYYDDPIKVQLVERIPKLTYQPSVFGTMLLQEDEICYNEEENNKEINQLNTSENSSGSSSNNNNATTTTTSDKNSSDSWKNVETSIQIHTLPMFLVFIWNSLRTLILVLFSFLIYTWNYRNKHSLDIAWDSDEFRALIANEVGTVFSHEIQKMLEDKVESGLNRDEVLKSVIREMQEVFTRELLEKKYGSSRPDFALSTVGARIIPHLTSLSYSVSPQSWTRKIISYISWRNNIVDNAPMITIAPGIYDGLCWSFAGQKGVLAVRLAKNAHINAITYEHISKEVAVRDEVSPAPKDFEVWGLPENGLELSVEDFTIFLGRFTYNVKESAPRQIFNTVTSEVPIRAVLFKIMNNWGNSKFTRVYRFRVHGDRVD
ncbi:11065_t:CDS:2 [Ambispora leptoticha]|uniref:11065_t:CDS:1 n=1 Tax=Ambispora leptoticha TaxID=144679 RepID=A0A9N9EBP2_9GLOM|nr:11065_t:CDS:2 [Ambispora leptoticha]